MLFLQFWCCRVFVIIEVFHGFFVVKVRVYLPAGVVTIFDAVRV